MARTESKSTMQRLIGALQEARAKLEAVKQEKQEPIAIVGLSCRFPGAENPEGFWQLLRNGVDAITEVPSDRWDIDDYYDPDPHAVGKICSRYGGFLEQVDRFDPQFFDISPREAVTMDPQQRLVLEVSWEALERAALPPAQLFGSSTGVFLGLSAFDHALRLFGGQRNVHDAYAGTGSALNVSAGRLSYLLGLTGPSMVVDTACSSSLVAIHLAVTSLRQKECQIALAGGVGVLLAPNVSINFSRAQMLAPDGRCKTFDAAANGYVRGEGCGIVVLKRLSDAIRDGNHILALIRGAAVNQDGASGGLTVPSGPSQEAVIRQALKNGGVLPSEVSYVEAHGTGTALGDPIEVDALDLVFGSQRKEPLMIGSVKTNIGHLESAAGIAGLIKVILSLQHKQIPPHLHFSTPNPHIPWHEFSISVPTKLMPWEGQFAKRIAGVSSFGFSGTNAHVILEEAAPALTPSPSPPGRGEFTLREKGATGRGQAQQGRTSRGMERPLHLLALSAKSEQALEALVARYASRLADDSIKEVELADICFTANSRRAHFRHRIALVARSTDEMREKLNAARAGTDTSGIWRGYKGRTKTVAFLFTGQGSQYVGMGQALYRTQPTFRATLERCSELVQPYSEHSLLDILYPRRERTNYLKRTINDTAYTQVALFALEYALAKLWQSWGIEPTVVMGHSVGELVAACVAGVFSLEDGLKLVAERGRLMQRVQRGQMAAVSASEATVRAIIADLPLERGYPLGIAAINGPQSVVISGAASPMQKAVERLLELGLRTKRLNVSHAFHSSMMEPIVEPFLKVARQITYAEPKIKLLSNVTGKLVSPSEITTPEYWARHIISPVRFYDGMKTLDEHTPAVDMFLEVGPKPTLLGMGRQCLPDHDGAWLPSLRREREWEECLSSLSRLYVHGIEVNWAAFDQDYARRQVPLPTYPFQRERHWVETSPLPEGEGPGVRAGAAGRRAGAEGVRAEGGRWSSLFELLDQGKTDLLAETLQKNNTELSSEQLNALPALLELLAEQHQAQLSSAEAVRDSSDWLYKIEWQAKPRQSTPSFNPLPPSQSWGGLRGGDGSWLILADEGGVGQALADRLAEWGQSAHLVYAPRKPGAEDDLGISDFEALLQARRARSNDFSRSAPQETTEVVTTEQPLRGIIHLWSLDLAAFDSTLTRHASMASEQLEQASRRNLGSLLHLVQAHTKSRSLSEQPTVASPRLWVVTRGAHSVAGAAQETTEVVTTNLAQAPIWGLGKVVALEHPELWGGLVDLEEGQAEVGALLQELWDAEGEDQIAYRHGKRFVARLVPAAAPSKPLALSQTGSYLITGGLGALGLEVAKVLVEQGARHLLLVGRSASLANLNHHQREAVKALEEAGAEVRLVKADISREEEVRAVLAEAPSLRGIIHAAGVLDDGILLRQSLERFGKVMAPKVKGTWNLHQQTKEMPLDFFVCFSSMASLLGSPGQGNYAAANAFMDALAHYRHALGLPALSINWGAWQIGMADAPAVRSTSWGITPIAPAEGVEIIKRLLASRGENVQVGVLPVKESAWPEIIKQQFFAHSVPGKTSTFSLLSDLAGQALVTLSPEIHAKSLTERLQEVMMHKRQEFLTRHIQSEVANVLGIQNPRLEVGFAEMGMDSLMAVELKNRLERAFNAQLPATLAFEYPTIESLSQHLLLRFAPKESPEVDSPLSNISDETEPEQPTEDDLTMKEEIKQLSALELLAQLSAELEG